jgi:hypothetical protein
MIENMEYVIVEGGAGKVLGMAVLSAENTDKVCLALDIADDKRNEVLLVCDRDSVYEDGVDLFDADWIALNRPNTEWNQATKDAEDALNRASGRSHA